MSNKLDDYVEDAKGHNIAEEGYELGKEKAKEAAEDKVKEVGKEAVNSAGEKIGKGAKKLHENLASRGGLYDKGTKAISSGAKKVAGKAKVVGSKLKAGAKAVGAFVKSGPMGWAAGTAMFIGVVLLVGGDGGDDYEKGYSSDDVAIEESGVDEEPELTEEERILLLDGVYCPEPVYAASVGSGESTGSSNLENVDSEYHRIAKAVFEKWASAGLSGEAAAGIVGWVSSEGGFHMVGKAEGIRSNDPKEASIAYGAVPIHTVDPSKDGGGGIYQTTPYTKYAPLGSPDWEDIDKMHEFVFDLVADNGTWQDWIPSYTNSSGTYIENDFSGKNHTFREFASSTNIEDTTLAWNSYERMNHDYWTDSLREQKIAEAKLAYDLFNGSSYKFNEEAFESNFGKNSDHSITVDGSYTDPCIPSYMGGSPWGGTGGQPSITSGSWKPGMVPDEIKKYALDPSKIVREDLDGYTGLISGDGSTWRWNTSGTDDQCTDLTANLTKLIWVKDGKSFPKTGPMGHGGKVARNYASEYGGSVTNQPSAGAIFSTLSGYAMCGLEKCGHTGIVSHVFDNGDFLIIEQNSGLSGKTAGEKNTFNYRIVEEADISSSGYSFFDPSTVGYTFTDGLTSL